MRSYSINSTFILKEALHVAYAYQGSAAVNIGLVANNVIATVIPVIPLKYQRIKFKQILDVLLCDP